MVRLLALALVLLAAAWPGAGRAAPSENRVALVIGNGRYATVPALPNPGGDADRVAAALREAGFSSVTIVHDAGRPELIAALKRFGETAERADWALIYYAGHGIEVGGINYVVPVDARLKSDRDIVDEAVPLDRLLQSIEAARKLRLVILDACRDNPFAAMMRRTSATRSIGHGLARVEPDGGTLVAFAARHGETALDGDEGGSPFVAALTRRLATPGLEINKLFRLVRDDVLAATDKRQEPFVYGSLPGEDFFFVDPGGKATAAPSLPEKLPSAAAEPSAPPSQVAALPPAALPPAALQPAEAPPTTARPSTPGAANPPVTGPLVSFTRSNSGWHASVSLPEAAIGVSWRLGDKGAFEDAALLDVLDQRTGRRMPNPAIELPGDTPAGTLQIRYVDAAGRSAGPFPIAFDPQTALARDQRRAMEMTSGSWLSFRSFNGVLLYYTQLVVYRCGIKELRIGLDRAEPDRVVALPPCDAADPYSVPGDTTPYLKVPAATRSASVQVVYRDGTASPVKLFKR